MSKSKEFETTKGTLVATPIPQETRTYKPITHKQLIDLTLESINQAGWNVEKETYSMAADGQIANGRYSINNLADSEMQIQIGWQNSYNKQLTLKWAIGVRVFICSNGCISGDMGAFKKKHTGDIQEYAPKSITEYIKTAEEVFVDMQTHRESMKQIEINERTAAELVGRMFIEEKFIESTQMNIIKRELNNATHDYGCPNSLWELYQFTTFALKTIHPAMWMDNHIKAHEFFTNEAKIIIPEVIINESVQSASPHKQLDWTEYVAGIDPYRQENNEFKEE